MQAAASVGINVRLRKIEAALESALDGAFDVLVRGQLHPLDVFRQLWRSIEDRRMVSAGTCYVPNRLTAKLNGEDFAGIEGLRQRLQREFERNLEEEAQQAGWQFGAMIMVRIVADDGLRRGKVQIDARTDETPVPANLLLTDGVNGPQTFPLSPQAVLGRLAQCDIVVPDHTVSRRHCRFDWLFLGYQVVDLGSSNGTFVNGVRVSSHVLHDQDAVTVGVARLKFVYDTEAAWCSSDSQSE